MQPKIADRGFTLIEMAMVLVIIGLLLGSILGPLSTQIDIKRYKDTAKLLTEISDALTGFAIVNQRLPCPDSTGDGFEDSDCAIEGDLPWATLGLGQWDAWGRRIRYRSDAAFNTAGIIPDPPVTISSLSVTDLNSVALTPAGDPVAIIFSCGKNGFPENENDADGIPNIDGVCSNPGVGTSNSIYVHDVYTKNLFDDSLIWISKNSLISRMAAAGKWP